MRFTSGQRLDGVLEREFTLGGIASSPTPAAGKSSSARSIPLRTPPAPGISVSVHHIYLAAAVVVLPANLPTIGHLVR
jgi:hypothetical protein